MFWKMKKKKDIWEELGDIAEYVPTNVLRVLVIGCPVPLGFLEELMTGLTRGYVAYRKAGWNR